MRLRLVTPASLLVVLGLLAGPARAQRAPDLATLDRGDGITKLGIDLGFSFLDPPPYDAGLRLEVWGQYVTKMGLGLYGAFPLSRSFGGEGTPSPPEAENTFAIGNLEIGGLYVIEAPQLSWVFRLGVALPTATSGYEGFFTNYLSTWPRLTDIALISPDTFYFRIAVSPLIHINKLFLRADIGFDLGVDNDDNGVEDADDLIRINVGGGVDLGMAALGIELVNLANLDRFDNDDRFVHTLTLTARFMGAQWQPFFAVGTPLDQFYRDRIKFYLAGGIQFASP